MTCGPRIHIKHRLHLSNHSGYKSCPFDLCITSYDALYKCIKDDFKNFFDLSISPGMNADGDRSKCGIGLRNITNSYGIVFNHEGATHSHLFNEGRNDDDFYIRNDFEKFKQRYTQRIQNFHNYMHEYDKIVLVHHNFNNARYNIGVICEILKERYPGKIFTILEI
jgi:hypothetical protein